LSKKGTGVGFEEFSETLECVFHRGLTVDGGGKDSDELGELLRRPTVRGNHCVEGLTGLIGSQGLMTVSSSAVSTGLGT
jgi:hypothetical protein